MYECCPSHVHDIESTDALLTHIEAVGNLKRVVIQGLDLTPEPVAHAVCSVSAEDACFLGCSLTPSVEKHIHATGGTVFPAFTGIPFHPYRAHLYTPDELMAGYRPDAPDGHTATVDHQIYTYYNERRGNGHDVPVMDALAFRIHDHAIDDALQNLLHPNDDRPDRKVVGIMGGHQLARDDATYRQVAHMGRALTSRGFFVATGGGPGAMEAANLGAALADAPEDALEEAVRVLARAPHYTDSGFLDAARHVREMYPDPTESLAIPTWFYGHEPSNLFSTHIAKYFANSIREDGLLSIATYGVVYAPGSAGTIQEIFMDAAQNHYETFGPASPMVFLDEAYWTETKPVYPLLQTLSEGTPYADHLAITDDPATAVEAIATAAKTRPTL